jgi:putative PIN family toxin of toxin-antitoxin system
MRVVLDTNVFISSFLGSGPPRIIIDLWKEGKITLCLSQPIVEEYTAILLRLGLSGKKELEELMHLFAKGTNIIFAGKTEPINLTTADPDDLMFFECAQELNAEYIISGDKVILGVKEFLGIKTITAANFIKLID